MTLSFALTEGQSTSRPFGQLHGRIPQLWLGQEPYQAAKIGAAQRIRDSTRDTRQLQLDRMAPGVAPLATQPLRTTNLIETFR